MQWVAIGAAVIILALAGVFLLQSDKPATGALLAEISVDEAYAKYQEGAFLLDVRTQAEWEDYHVPGATLIPLEELPERVNELPRDQEIVVVCRSGNRSQAGRDALLDAGFSQVTSMADGINEWRAAGYPTVSGP
ncbi:MAG: rhodanese-like domain-containing protein [Anaerolineales bacterium]|nr:rhodanese-like domain-containing protein [Anaerolineales bacterium]